MTRSRVSTYARRRAGVRAMLRIHLTMVGDPMLGVPYTQGFTNGSYSLSVNHWALTLDSDFWGF